MHDQQNIKIYSLLFTFCELVIEHARTSYFCMYGGADKSLARPTSRCRTTESIVSLEANLLLRPNKVCLLQTVKNFQRDERQLICLIFKQKLSVRAKHLSAPLYINSVVDNFTLPLYLGHDFVNIVFKIKYKFISSLNEIFWERTWKNYQICRTMNPFSTKVRFMSSAGSRCKREKAAGKQKSVMKEESDRGKRRDKTTGSSRRLFEEAKV